MLQLAAIVAGSATHPARPVEAAPAGAVTAETVATEPELLLTQAVPPDVALALAAADADVSAPAVPKPAVPTPAAPVMLAQAAAPPATPPMQDSSAPLPAPASPPATEAAPPSAAITTAGPGAAPAPTTAEIGAGEIGADAALIDGRRRPGAQQGLPDRVTQDNEGALRAPPPEAFPTDQIPVPDRWRLIKTLCPLKNSVFPTVEAVCHSPFDPYHQNFLKGDRPIDLATKPKWLPIKGDDWFLALTGISDTILEPRTFPTPVSRQINSRPGSLNVFGKGESIVAAQTFIVGGSLIKGSTAYMPPIIEYRLILAYNINYVDVNERRVLDVRPSKKSHRTDDFLGLQEAFVDYHIRNTSDRFDFDSVRVGIQPFQADFRGFLFNDNQLGIRFFGNRDDNRFQYNLAAFWRMEKDTNSGLNDPTQKLRQDYVFIANLYRQDLPIPGITSQVTAVVNVNREDEIKLDDNGFPVRPALLGTLRGRHYDVAYLGYNADGRIGRMNLTASLYAALGEDRDNFFTGRKAKIRAFFGAAEASYDVDFLRFRASALYASGDKTPFNNTESGFDAIFENPIFAGADTSYNIRQTIPFAGGGRVIALTGRNGILNSLRSSKEQGQSNFLNPGTVLLGVGADADVTPQVPHLGQPQPSLVRPHAGAAGAADRRIDPEKLRLGLFGGDDLPAQGDPERRVPPLGGGVAARQGLPRPVRQRAGLQALLFRPVQHDPVVLMRMGANILKVRLSRPMKAVIAAALAIGVFGSAQLLASEGEKPRDIKYVFTPPAPQNQGWPEADGKSGGCVSCHTESDRKTMHDSPAVVLGCVDCHGGDAKVTGDPKLPHDAPAYVAARDRAHVLPRYPETWHWPSSANPQRSYTLLNKEAPEYIRFVNPSDYRVARESCGACHLEVIQAAERSLMTTGAMLWGGASYNNGIAPFKNYVFGESYTTHGEPGCIISAADSFAPSAKMKNGKDEPCGLTPNLTPAQTARGALAKMYPLPTWHVIPPGDIFRVFERGGRNINTQFPEIGLPNITGSIQRLEEPGRPDLRQSNRGPATGLRVAIPVLNIHKTRLNDPFMWFMGTNDQPGDYRNSGCAGCHVIYANDREPTHSLIYAKYGRDGQTATVDPTIKDLVERTEAHGEGHGAAAKHEGPAKHAEPEHGAATPEAGEHAGARDRRASGRRGRDQGKGPPDPARLHPAPSRRPSA